MARPQFSQMLVDRRRDLGLTIDQAARVLKMKEQVLTAFETGDWDRIPRSGYAQGMLSSYARYLGLNPRHVIDQFKQDLYAYSHASPADGGGEGQASNEHRRLAGYADRYAGQGRRSTLSDDIDLYGSAGPAGSIMSSGTFDDEMYRRLARDRGGHRGVGYSERYLERSGDEPPSRSRGGGRPYTNRVPDRGTAPRQRDVRQRSSIAVSKARSATRQTIQTRAVDAHYEDDLRYDRARPYEAASTEQGRADSRHIARPERPNIPRNRSDARRRPDRDGATGGRRGGRSGDRGRDRRGGGRGRPSQTPSYLAFDARTLTFIVIGLFVVLMVAILFTIGSCVGNVTNSEKPQVPVGTAPSEVGTDADADTEADADDEADADADADAGDSTSRTSGQGSNANLTGTVTTSPDTVTVSVQDGKVSWVEVVMGDVSLVAQTVSGPWQQTFQVTGPMEIQASDAAAVHVTADGTPVNFDSKASGVGVIAIEGPSTDDADEGDSDEGKGDARSRSVDGSGTGSASSGTGGAY